MDKETGHGKEKYIRSTGDTIDPLKIDNIEWGEVNLFRYHKILPFALRALHPKMTSLILKHFMYEGMTKYKKQIEAGFALKNGKDLFMSIMFHN